MFSLGAIESPTDCRDVFSIGHISPVLVSRRPVFNDLRAYFADEAWDQGQEGTCVAQSVVAILDAHLKAGGQLIELSRRDAYEGARLVTPVKGDGSQPRAMFSWCHNQGLCRASDWPYVPGKIGEPGPEANSVRPDYKIQGYARVTAGPWGFLSPSQSPDYVSIANAMHAHGPVQLTIEVTEQIFEPVQSGDTWIAKPGGKLVGLHSVAACGWRDSKSGTGEVLIRNSWGTGWGDKGYAWLQADSIMKESWLILPWSYKDRPAELPTVSWQQSIEANIWPW